MNKISETNELIAGCLSFLKTSDLAKARLISKVFRDVINHSAPGQSLWKEASIREGVPIVEGSNRNYKDDFQFLRPITISRRIIGRYLGKLVGEVPRMREDRFLQLKYSQDPFNSEMLQSRAYVVIVDPSELKITVSPNRPLALDPSGTLVEVAVEQREGLVPEELTVRFSLKNLKMLATYPLAGMGTGPVFDVNSKSEVFDQCNTPLDQNKIRIMRREVIGRNMHFNGEQGQHALVRNHGWEVATVLQRVFYDAIEILKTGTCPDVQDPWTYARSAEGVRIGEHDYIPTIGGFAPDVGVRVLRNYNDFASVSIGVVPVVPAEV